MNIAYSHCKCNIAYRYINIGHSHINIHYSRTNIAFSHSNIAFSCSNIAYSRKHIADLRGNLSVELMMKTMKVSVIFPSQIVLLSSNYPSYSMISKWTLTYYEPEIHAHDSSPSSTLA